MSTSVPKSNGKSSTPPLPQIRVEHPLSRVGKSEDLGIVGTNSQPASKYSSTATPRRPLESSCETFTVEKFQHEGSLASPKSGERDYGGRKRIDSAAQLEDTIRKKLNTAYYGIRHQFKSNDPTGGGVLSKEGLHRVICQTCGIVSMPTVSHLLRNLGLDEKKPISFDDFIKHFSSVDTVNREWISPAREKELLFHARFHHIEDALRDRSVSFYERQGTVTHCIAQLKQRMQDSAFQLEDYLPSECLGAENGHMFPYHLRQFLSKLNVEILNEEFPKLFKRLDVDNMGYISTAYFCKVFGIDVAKCASNECKESKPPAEEAPKLERSRTMPISLRPKYTEDLPVRRVAAKKGVAQHRMSLPSKLTSQPDIFQLIMTKLDDGYRKFMKSFEKVDEKRTGWLSKVDARILLKIHGINLGAIDFEHFLIRLSLRHENGRFNYFTFMYKVQQRNENALLQRILACQNHPYHFRERLSDEEHLSAAQAEAKIVEIFHKDYLLLQKSFQEMDSEASGGTISQSSFQRTLESVLKMSISTEQMNEICKKLNIHGENASIPWQQFMDNFRKIEELTSAAAAPEAEAPVDVVKTRLNDPFAHSAPQVKPRAQHNSTAQHSSNRADYIKLFESVRSIVCNHFYTLNISYMILQAKPKGKLRKQQMKTILKSCGLDISEEEQNLLWSFFPVDVDGLVLFSDWVKFFTLNNARTFQTLCDKKGKLGTKETAKEEDSPPVAPAAARVPTPAPAPVPAQRVKTVRSLSLDGVLTKIRPTVVTQWSALKGKLRAADPKGEAAVSTADFKSALAGIGSTLNHEETELLARSFAAKSPCQIDYMPFMKRFAKSKPCQVGEQQ